MHKAPTVDYPVGSSRFQNIASFVLLSGVAGMDALWFPHLDWLDWRLVLGVGITLACAVVALWSWRVAPTGTLHWDGQSWWWASRENKASGVVTPHLDLQSILLVRFAGHSGVRHWLWLEQSAAPMRWNALRRAVHAPGPEDSYGNPGDGTLAAGPARRGEKVRF